MLVSLSRAFDVAAVDSLLFLNQSETKKLRISGDGVLAFSRLIAAGLASFKQEVKNGPLVLYSVALTQKGQLLISAWTSGDRVALESALGGPDRDSE